MPIEPKKNTKNMTQEELEIKRTELYRAYCAKTAPVKREMAQCDAKTRETRQGISRLYENLLQLRDSRTEMERKLRQLKDEYLEEKTRLLQTSVNKQEPSPRIASIIEALRSLAEEYPGQTIGSILRQLEARANEPKPTSETGSASVKAIVFNPA